MFEGRKIRKLLGQYAAAQDEQEEKSLVREFDRYGVTVVSYAVKALQEKSLGAAKAQALLALACDDSCCELCVSLLGDPYDEARRIAKELLAKRWSRSASPLLLSLLDSSDHYSRTSATELLSLFKDQSCVPSLVELFNVKGPEVKRNIIKILAEMGGPASKKLIISALYDQNWQVRLAAVKSLGRMKAPESIDPLLERIAENDPHIKGLALEALAAIGDIRAARPIIQLLKDDDLLIRQKAADCLIDIGDSTIVPEVINLMHDSDVNVRRSAVEVLKNLKDPRTAEVLMKAIKDSDWWVRQIATDSLTKLEGDNNIVRGFLGLLPDADENVRRCAVEFFIKVPDQQALEPLIGRLADQDWWVREKAARALGVLKNPKAIAPLVSLVNDYEVGWVVPIALGDIGSPEALEHLRRFLFDGAKRVRLEAIKSLGRLNAREMVDDLKECLNDPDGDIRNEAAEAMKLLIGRAMKAEEVPGRPEAKVIVSRTTAPEGTTVSEAVLVLDLCNSTEIITQYGDSFALNMMKSLTDIVTPIAKRERYQFLKGTGDGFLITFPKAVNAVLFAREVLARVAERNQRVDASENIALRFGVNFGEAKINEKGDRLGASVSTAFRVEGVKTDGLVPLEGGMNKEDIPLQNRIMVTEHVARELKGLEDFRIQLVGLFELKGITGLHRIFLVT